MLVSLYYNDLFGLQKECPELTASFLSRITFSWITRWVSLVLNNSCYVLNLFCLSSLLDTRVPQTTNKSTYSYASIMFKKNVALWHDMFNYRLIITGYRRQLTFDDIWQLRKADQCAKILPEFEAEWNKELLKHNQRFVYLCLELHLVVNWFVWFKKSWIKLQCFCQMKFMASF